MKKFAVIGNPIKHSLSPIIHQNFAKQFKIKLEYQKILATDDNFKKIVTDFFKNGGVGLNITVPFKFIAFNLCDILSDRANMAGSVNTLYLDKNNKICGDNTDGAGLVNDLEQNLNYKIKNKKILIYGAGGATAGIIYPILQNLPKNIDITNRTIKKAYDMAERFNKFGNIQAISIDKLNNNCYDLIINATSTGLSGETLPLTSGIIHNTTLCYDLAYSKKPTNFMLWADKNGANKTTDGKGMLKEQAAISFYIWHHKKPI
ncbi:MAG: shikimate dehydrogenase [Gammaproteobacteria bacterium]|nr:MAG: shikimate dehydrogenase [Gammaproteobacteria bacterium]